MRPYRRPAEPLGVKMDPGSMVSVAKGKVFAEAIEHRGLQDRGVIAGGQGVQAGPARPQLSLSGSGGSTTAPAQRGDCRRPPRGGLPACDPYLERFRAVTPVTPFSRNCSASIVRRWSIRESVASGIMKRPWPGGKSVEYLLETWGPSRPCAGRTTPRSQIGPDSREGLREKTAAPTKRLALGRGITRRAPLLSGLS